MIRNLYSRKIIQLIAGGAVLFYIMSGISSVLNYALYPLLSRILPVQDYGEIQFLLSTSNQLSFGFVVLNILAIIITASAKSVEEKADATRSLTIVAGAISLFISLVGAALLVIFADTLQISSPLSTLLLAASFVLNVPFTTLLGRLQGDGKFVTSGIISLVATVGKFVFSLLFVVMGLGVVGVMAGVVCGMITALVIGAFYVHQPHQQERIGFRKHTLRLSSIRGQSLASAVAVLVITLLSGIDLVASRMLLDSTDAGFYSVIATLAKITIATCNPLIWLTLPRAVKDEKRAIRNYIYISIIICALFTIPLAIAPFEITKLFMSVDPGIYISLLLPLTLSMSIYAVAFITLSSVIATGALKATYISVIISLVSFTGVGLFLLVSHGKIEMNDVIIAQFIAGISLLIANIFTLTARKKNIRV